MLLYLFAQSVFSTQEEDDALYSNFEPVHMAPLTKQLLKGRLNKLKRSLGEESPMIETEEERQPFKIDFDLSGFDGTGKTDPYMCTEVGQKISWDFAPNYTCTKKDILTEEKKNALLQTLDNINDLLGRAIRVKNSKIYLINSTEEPFDFTVNKPISDKSLHARVFIRPLLFKTVALSGVLNVDEATMRPVQSLISFTPRYLPTVAESENSTNRYFFNLVFHEIMHSIGMSYEFFGYWINKSTGLPYGYRNIFDIYQDPAYPNEEFYQLCTPKATEVARKRLGRDKYPWGDDVCLEVENLGGDGTILSHPKGTVYRQDVMVGIPSKGDAVISEVILALVEDMGWYTVNWNVAQPITWGEKDLLTKEELDNLPLKPVWKKMPKSYIYDPKDMFFVSHDYKSHGYTIMMKYDRETDPRKLVQFGDLYLDGVTDFWTDNNVWDYSLLKGPTETCDPNSWAHMIYTRTEQKAVCLNGTLTKDSFTFTYNNTEFKYSKEGPMKLDDNTIIQCNDVQKMNKIVEVLNRKPVDYGHIPLYNPNAPTVQPTPETEDSDDKQEEKNVTKKRIILYSSISAACLLVIIFIVVFVVICKRKHKKLEVSTAEMLTPIL